MLSTSDITPTAAAAGSVLILRQARAKTNNKAGQIIWQSVRDGAVGIDMAVDPVNNVIAVGSVGTDVLVRAIRYSDARVMWEYTGRKGQATGVTLNQQGSHPVVVGTYVPGGKRYFCVCLCVCLCFCVLAMNSASEMVVWPMSRHGVANIHDAAASRHRHHRCLAESILCTDISCLTSHMYCNCCYYKVT